jgi:hypothetical protein
MAKQAANATAMEKNVFAIKVISFGVSSWM